MVHDYNKTGAPANYPYGEVAADLLEILVDIIAQECTTSDGTLIHYFVSTYEAAFRLLEQYGQIEKIYPDKELYRWVRE